MAGLSISPHDALVVCAEIKQSSDHIRHPSIAVAAGWDIAMSKLPLYES